MEITSHELDGVRAAAPGTTHGSARTNRAALKQAIVHELVRAHVNVQPTSWKDVLQALQRDTPDLLKGVKPCYMRSLVCELAKNEEVKEAERRGQREQVRRGRERCGQLMTFNPAGAREQQQQLDEQTSEAPTKPELPDELVGELSLQTLSSVLTDDPALYSHVAAAIVEMTNNGTVSITHGLLHADDANVTYFAAQYVRLLVDRNSNYDLTCRFLRLIRGVIRMHAIHGAAINRRTLKKRWRTVVSTSLLVDTNGEELIKATLFAGLFGKQIDVGKLNDGDYAKYVADASLSHELRTADGTQVVHAACVCALSKKFHAPVTRAWHEWCWLGFQGAVLAVLGYLHERDYDRVVPVGQTPIVGPHSRWWRLVFCANKAHLPADHVM